MDAPWNASWTAEERFEVRPCRWAGGRPAIWQPHKPGDGKPIFAKPHSVRQRRSIAEMRCTVCGLETAEGYLDRWWFGLVEYRDGWWMTQEAPVHLDCAILALEHCPHLRHLGRDPMPHPGGYRILRSMVGGERTESDFGIRLQNPVVGHLKLGWRFDPRPHEWRNSGERDDG